MRIAREGYPLIFAGGIIALLAFLAGWMPLGIILGLIALAVAAFFRDPERQAPAAEGLVSRPQMVKWSAWQGSPAIRRFRVALQE